MWNELSFIVKKASVLVRIIMLDGTATGWSKSLIVPTDGYAETPGFGPFRTLDAQCVEIDVMQKQRLGRLLPERLVDRSEDIELALKNAGLYYERDGAILRIVCK